jgi:hypothetical protein
MPVFCLVHPTLSFSMALETADLAAVFTLVMAAAVFFAAAEPVSLATWDTIRTLFDDHEQDPHCSNERVQHQEPKNSAPTHKAGIDASSGNAVLNMRYPSPSRCDKRAPNGPRSR